MKDIVIKPRKKHPRVINHEGCKGCMFAPADGRTNACKTCANFLIDYCNACKRLANVDAECSKCKSGSKFERATAKDYNILSD